MKITPILIILILISIVQAALVTRIPKPKPNMGFSQKLKSPEIPKHKLPEERRKFSLFPKSYMKFVISPEPIYKIATLKPIVHGTKKPLMKKLNLQGKKNKAIENEAERIETEPMNENNVAVIPKVNDVVGSEEVSIESVQERSEETNEMKKQNNNSEEEEDKIQNNSNEIKTETADTAIKETHSLKDLIFTPETLDWTEFIFVDPAHKQKHTESDRTSSAEQEEYVTTEFYEEPEIDRRKRGSNVIEEENLASTVAGYKYTWKDTPLNNEGAFKNIHS